MGEKSKVLLIIEILNKRLIKKHQIKTVFWTKLIF